MRRLAPILLVLLLFPVATVLADPDDPDSLILNINVEGDEVEAHLSINATKSMVVVNGVEIQEELKRIASTYKKTRNDLSHLSKALEAVYNIVVDNDNQLAEEILALKEQVDYVREFVYAHEKDVRTLNDRAKLLAVAVMILHDNLTRACGRIDELDKIVELILDDTDALDRSITRLEDKLGNLEIIIEDHGKALEEMKREQVRQARELEELGNIIIIVGVLVVVSLILSVYAIKKP